MSTSQADVWYLKDILFNQKHLKIITQNFNGPCSFIAICNILILRGQIHILPQDRQTVSYEFLSQLVGEYLLTNCPDMDISAALSIMPSTTKGLDLNPQFTSVTAFSPASDAGELALFAQAGVPLVHGWVVDPDSPEAPVMAHIRDYDTAVTLIADADYITQGGLLSGGDAGARSSGGASEAGPPTAGPSSGSAVAGPSSAAAGFGGLHASPYSAQDQHKIEQAIVAQQFLDATKSQLTYHGLFQLASTLAPGSLAALFRNAHLSVVYKSPGGPPPDAAVNPNPHPGAPVGAGSTPSPADSGTPTEHDAALYALVTDHAFLHEPSIVWERLEDVDGGASWFVDANFRRAVPVGGDIAGQTAEGALRLFDMEAGLCGIEDPADFALAKRIQAEEDARAREMYMRRQQALARRRAVEEEERQRRENKSRGSKKHKNCVIM